MCQNHWIYRVERKENLITSGESGEQHDFKFMEASELEIIFMFILIVMKAEEMCEVFH